MSSANWPPSRSSRERVSSQIDVPASCRLCRLGFGAIVDCSSSLGCGLRDERVEWRVSVAQRSEVNGLAGADQLLDVLVDIPNVDVHPSEHALLAQPEGDELAAVALAAEQHLIPLGCIARVLHPDFVLV